MPLTWSVRSDFKNYFEMSYDKVLKFPQLLLDLFVCSCHAMFLYLGMVIWGGAIKVGSYPDITPLYDQNNFNSYWELGGESWLKQTATLVTPAARSLLMKLNQMLYLGNGDDIQCFYH
jgi:hypothetical protein